MHSFSRCENMMHISFLFLVNCDCWQPYHFEYWFPFYTERSCYNFIQGTVTLKTDLSFYIESDTAFSDNLRKCLPNQSHAWWRVCYSSYWPKYIIKSGNSNKEPETQHFFTKGKQLCSKSVSTQWFGAKLSNLTFTLVHLFCVLYACLQSVHLILHFYSCTRILVHLSGINQQNGVRLEPSGSICPTPPWCW